jgi:protein phosphatase
MGGTNAGEVASHLAQESVQKAFQQLASIPDSSSKREKFLRQCILNAHEQIVEHQHKHLDTAGMGTTLVIAWVIGESLHTAWSGDSRCYVYDGTSPLKPFTDDHSMVWELVKKGSLSPEEARTHPESNLILQSLGSPDNPPKPSVRSTKLRTGDRVLVCSDGLNGMLPDQRIEQLLSEENGTAETCADLVKQANMAGGEDNITCLLLDVLDTEEQPAKTKKGSGAATGVSGQTSNIENAIDENPLDSADAFEKAANATLSDKHDDTSGRSGRPRMLFAGISIILLAGLLYLLLRPGTPEPSDPPEPSVTEIAPEDGEERQSSGVESDSLNQMPLPEVQEAGPPSVPEPVQPEPESQPSPEAETEASPEESEPEFRVPPDQSANTSKPAVNMQQESKPSVNDDKDTNMPADSAGVVIPDSVSAGSTKPAEPDSAVSMPADTIDTSAVPDSMQSVPEPKN